MARERTESTQQTSDIHSSTIYELEDEMNTLTGFVSEFFPLLLFAGWSQQITGMPEYMLGDCIEKMERLDEINQEMIGRLIKQGERKDI